MAGLLTNFDQLTLSENFPGAAIRMINYEPSSVGGYRRISGYTNTYGTVPGEDNAPVLGTAVYGEINDGIFAARKPASGNHYFHYWDAGAGSWTTPSTSGSPTMTGVSAVRFTKINWGVPKLVLTDGVNPAATWDGTTYTQITGSTAPSNPLVAESFSNHLFMAGGSGEETELFFSAPNNETDFTPASGGGVINVGFPIVAIKSFRDQLFVFGKSQIKRVVGQTIADFDIEDVTTELGCLSTDSVVEFNGDVIFLSADGIRPVSGTSRIGDVELNTLSKPIQSTIEDLSVVEDFRTAMILVLNKKTQFRMFFYGSNSAGLLGSLRRSGNTSGAYEYSQLVGFDVSCVDSGFIDGTEYVLHGDTSGKLMREETGQNFNGSGIFSLFQTPYLHMEDPLMRKTILENSTYLKSEGSVEINLGVSYDFDDTAVFNPGDRMLSTEGTAAYYGSAIYDSTFTYDGNPNPVAKAYITGSGKTVSFKYVTTKDQPSHTVQAFVVAYKLNDRR